MPGRFVLALDVGYLRAERAIEGSGETRLTRSLDETTDTVYEDRTIRFGVACALGTRVTIEAILPYEEREMLNRAFPAEGAYGLRRHLLLRGLGDGTALASIHVVPARADVVDRVGRGSLDILAGAVLPTGPTLPEPGTGAAPYETVLQIGSGTVMPVLGVERLQVVSGRASFLAHMEGRGSFYANRDGFRRGSSVLLSAMALVQPAAGRLGLGAGPALAWRTADERHAEIVRNTGGVTLYAVAAGSFDLGRGFSANALARVPAWREVVGFQLREAFALSLGAQYAWR